MTPVGIGAVASDDGPVLARALRRYWVPIVAAVLLGALIGGFASQLQPVRFTAESRIVLSKVLPFDPLGTFANADAPRYIANQVAIMTSESILESAATELGDTSAETLRETVEATGGSDDDVITVTANAPAAGAAKRRADAVTNAYVEFRQQQVTQQTASALEQTTDAQLQGTIRTQAATYGSGVSLTQPAVLPTSPSAPLPARNAFVLALAYGLLALGYALLQGSRPTHAERIASAAAAADVPVLGSVPGELLTVTGPLAGSGTESFRMLLVTLHHLNRDGMRVLVTSESEGGGTTTAVNLALVAARQGVRVLLVDGYGMNGHVARQSRALEPSPEATPSPDDLRSWTVGGTSVDVLIAGQAAGALTSARPLSATLAHAQRNVDLVILDAPPPASSADGFAMVGEADTIMFVVDDRTRPAALITANDRLAYAGARITGLVVAVRKRRRMGGLRRWLGRETQQTKQVARALPSLSAKQVAK